MGSKQFPLDATSLESTVVAGSREQGMLFDPRFAVHELSVPNHITAASNPTGIQ